MKLTHWACPHIRVALLAEGVDRNLTKLFEEYNSKVALLAEGVDRNIDINRKFTAAVRSPSSRRAWIEIINFGYRGSVIPSPSSRRAWIEIGR